MKIYLATNNPHKKEEISKIFSSHTILMPRDAGIDFDFEETGTTYLENALGKAITLFRSLGEPVVADDSGLSVPALGGAPGIYSSRYGSEKPGEKLEQSERNKYLLAKMQGIQDRRAFFVCCMVLVLEDYRIFTAQETVHGTIIHEPKGSGGFGYDPLFYIEDFGKTVAELSEGEKNRISHRGRAGAVINAILNNLNKE